MDTQAPAPLDYRSPHTAARRPLFSIPAFVHMAVIVAVILLDLLLVIPRFKVIFLDFAAQLPAITVWLFDLSDLFRRGRWTVFLALPVVAGFLGAAFTPLTSDAHPSGRRRRPWLFLLTAFALTIILFVTVVALVMPMISLIRAITGR